MTNLPSASASLLGLALAAVLPAAAASAQLGVQQAEDSQWGSAGQEDYGGAGGAWVEQPSGGRVTVAGGSLGPRTVPETYTVRKGDTLWDITAHFYGNPWEWPRVWSYNPDITNPHWIYPGDPVSLRSEGGEGGGGLPGEDGVDVAATGDVGPMQPGAVLLREQGYLDPDALEAACEIVGSPEDKMMLAPWDEVYIECGEDREVGRGEQLTVFRRIPGEERNEEEAGILVRILGTVQVRSYDGERGVGRALITEALDPIERGFRIAAMPRRFEMVPPRRNEKDMQAEVVATLRPRRLLADQQMVFVDVGGEQGVKEGNRFFVVREGDQWRRSITTQGQMTGASEPDAEELEEYPPQIIAEARVVDVRPKSSALFITRSVRAAEVGDRAEMRKGF